MARNYNFGEKPIEKLKGVDAKVIQLPKYVETKNSAIALMESETYKGIISEGDFWILKNNSKDGSYVLYSNLIITHDALIKINNALPEETRFRQEYLSDPIVVNYGGKTILSMTYRDPRDGMYEVGEISEDNLRAGSYPLAMLSKRIFDRVVKRKSNLSGLYSESEADEFSKSINIDKETGEVLEPETSKDLSTRSKEKEAEIKKDNVEEKETTPIGITDALTHILETGAFKGKPVEYIVNGNAEDKVKIAYLTGYSTRGTDKDSRACKSVLAAIKTNGITFKRVV